MIVYQVIILIVGLTLYRYNKGILPCYWLVLSTLALPIVAYLGNATSMDDVNATYGIQNRTLLGLFFICILLNFDKVKFIIKSFKSPLMVGFSLVFVRIIWACYHNSTMSLFEILYDERFYFFTMIVPIFMYSIKQTSGKQILNILLFVTATELLVALLNHYLGFHLYRFHYFTNDTMKDVFTSGTFRRFSVLAAFLGIIQIFVATLFFVKRDISFKTFLFLTFCIGFVTALTGSRTGFYAFLLANALPLFLNYSRNKKYIITAVVLVFIFIGYIFTLSTTLSTKDADNGIDRILYGMVEKTNKKATDYGAGTDNMTYELIDKYATLDPLGNGYAANCDPAIAYKMNHVQDDCALAYMIVEKGWLYSLLCLLYFFTLYKTLTIKMPPQEAQSVAVAFFVVALMSVTDEGIFNSVNLTLVYLFAYWRKYGNLIGKETKANNK